MNERIRVREVRLIDAEGRQVGIVPTDDARRMATEAGMVRCPNCGGEMR